MFGKRSSYNHGQYLTLDFSPLPLPLNSMLGLHVARIERAKKKCNMIAASTLKLEGEGGGAHQTNDSRI